MSASTRRYSSSICSASSIRLSPSAFLPPLSLTFPPRIPDSAESRPNPACASRAALPRFRLMRAMLADRSRSALADPHRFPYSPICRSASIPRLPTSMRSVDANSRRRIRIRTSGSPPSRPRPTARTHLSGSNPSPIAQARTGLRRLDPFVAGVEQPSPRSEPGRGQSARLRSRRRRADSREQTGASARTVAHPGGASSSPRGTGPGRPIDRAGVEPPRMRMGRSSRRRNPRACGRAASHADRTAAAGPDPSDRSRAVMHAGRTQHRHDR